MRKNSLEDLHSGKMHELGRLGSTLGLILSQAEF